MLDAKPPSSRGKMVAYMRILLVVVYYPPNTTSAAQMMRDLAVEFTRRGHDVTVVAPSESVVGARSITEEDGVTVVRVKTGDLKSAHKILRLWRESQLSANIWKNVRDVFKKNPCDLIVFYSPTIFFGSLVSRLKALWSCPSYLIHRDIFPKWAIDAGILREGGILHRYLRGKELEQYAAADIIGVEAPGNLVYFENGMQGGNYQVEVLYNWIGKVAEPTGSSIWRQKLGLEGKVVFFFGGNIGVAQDPDNILRLARSLQYRRDIFFLLVGGGSEVPRLNREIEKLGLSNITILPPLPQQDYMQCLSEFDVGLVSLDRRLQSNNFTGKSLGYFSCSKPILASVNPGNDLLDLLRRADAGIACTNGEDDDLVRGALQLTTEPEVRRCKGNNARALAQTIFSVETISRQILSHFAIATTGEECARGYSTSERESTVLSLRDSAR
jgi:glycosyltransferase involved in cell wall biosynthesis